MTAIATIDNAIMVHFSTLKASGRTMASLAGCGSYNMVRRFTFSRRAIMTTGTTGGDAFMVHCRTFKARGRAMTSFA